MMWLTWLKWTETGPTPKLKLTKEMTYSEKLKDPRWQKKRLDILNRDGFACQSCMDWESTLHVHHKRYLPQKEPWDYDDDWLITLCERCHEKEKEAMDDALKDLCAAVRVKFLSGGIKSLVNGFTNYEHVLDSEVSADAIAFLLSSRKLLRDVVDYYFQSLEKNKKVNG